MLDEDGKRKRIAVQLELFPAYVHCNWEELTSQTAEVSELREERVVRDGAAAAGKNVVRRFLRIMKPVIEGLDNRKEVNYEP